MLKKNQTTADLEKTKLFANFGLRPKESWVKLFTRRPGKLQDN
jgi:hypothetical protein